MQYPQVRGLLAPAGAGIQVFFFEKKNQKTFIRWDPRKLTSVHATSKQRKRKSFLVLFFQKEHVLFLSAAADPDGDWLLAGRQRDRRAEQAERYERQERQCHLRLHQSGVHNSGNDLPLVQKNRSRDDT
jgi:hypothetical protein